MGSYTQDRLGEAAYVHTFEALDHPARQLIMIAPDVPELGAKTYASVGLSERVQPNFGNPIRIELIGACWAEHEEFAAIMASCLIECLQNGSEITYGVVFRDIVRQYCASDTMAHVTFVAPAYWDGFTRAEMSDCSVLWLMILPISKGETMHLKTHGIDALERRLEAAEADVFDLERTPIL